MRVAKIQFTKAQIKMLTAGETLILNLPDSQVHLSASNEPLEKESSLFDDIFSKFDNCFKKR